MHSCPNIIIIIKIILGLGSTNKWEHEILLDLLSLAYLTQHDDLQFHLFFCQWHHCISLCGWVTFFEI
jgi:hypothetical protein